MLRLIAKGHVRELNLTFDSDQHMWNVIESWELPDNYHVEWDTYRETGKWVCWHEDRKEIFTAQDDFNEWLWEVHFQDYYMVHRTIDSNAMIQQQARDITDAIHELANVADDYDKRSTQLKHMDERQLLIEFASYIATLGDTSTID
jgi:hypothetical protein